VLVGRIPDEGAPKSTVASLATAHHSRIVAATGALVAAAAVTVTLAVANGGSDTLQGQPSVAPAKQAPAGTSASEQFHHFRDPHAGNRGGSWRTRPARIYAKLGIRSRTELAAIRLASDGRSRSPARPPAPLS
jgi:hypothetical protein